MNMLEGFADQFSIIKSDGQRDESTRKVHYAQEGHVTTHQDCSLVLFYTLILCILVSDLVFLWGCLINLYWTAIVQILLSKYYETKQTL